MSTPRRGDTPAAAARAERAGPRRTSTGGEQTSGESGRDAFVEQGAPPAPWHFKVLLVGTVLYLLYRLVWFVFWLTGHAWHG